MTPQPYATRGSGIILPSRKPDSNSQNSTGLIAPSKPGWIGTIEPWEAHLVSAARFVFTEDRQLIYLGFRVCSAAASDDQCTVAILDEFGVVLWQSGLTNGNLNVVGERFVNLSNFPLEGGKVYYAAFGYGAVGTPDRPAHLYTACYPDAPDLEGYQPSPQQYGYQDTAIWTTADGTIGNPAAAVAPISPYANYGEAVAMIVRWR